MPNLRSQQGFTLIELLTTTAILSILMAVAMTSFFVYQKDAYYARAANDMKNAKTAAFVGLTENSALANVPFTYTSVDGGPVPAALSAALPGAVTSRDTRLGVQFSECSNDLDMQMFFVSQPCKGEKYLMYAKLCNGIEIWQPKLAKPYGCN